MSQQQCDDCGTKYSGASCPECAERSTGVKPEVEKHEVATRQQSTALALKVEDIDKRSALAIAMPRDRRQFVDDVMLELSDPDVALEAWYARPQGGKMIEGPSVRLAEIIASNYGNCAFKVGEIHEDEKFVSVEYHGTDLQKNSWQDSLERRSIVDRNGKRYSQSMVETTIRACKAVAYREVVFKVVPAVFVKQFKAEAVRVVDDQIQKRPNDFKAYIAEEFEKLGVKPKQLSDTYGFEKTKPVTAKQLKDLLMVLNSMKSGYNFEKASNTVNKKSLQSSEGANFSFKDFEKRNEGAA